MFQFVFLQIADSERDGSFVSSDEGKLVPTFFDAVSLSRESVEASGK